MTRTAFGFDVAPGIRLAADSFGDPHAPAVLMLHGGGQTRHAWQATATSLADAAAAVAPSRPPRARPRDTAGLRHNLRYKDGRWTWHWDSAILTQARLMIQQQSELSDRLTKAATRLRQPCLLVRGAESDVLTIAVAREFVELAATATLVEVPRAAHMVAGDNSDAFTAAIRAWLDMLAAGTSPTLRRRAKFGLLWR